MRHKIWLTLISAVLLSSVGATGMTSPSIHAARGHHIRVTRQRSRYRARQPVIRRIPAGVYPKDLLYYVQNGQPGYTSFYFNHPRYRTQMSRGYIRSVVNNEYRYINRARHSIHELSMIKNGTLIKLANWRAHQAQRYFTHYNRKGQPLAWTDAKQMRLGSYRFNQKNIGENMFFIGKLSQVHTDNGLAGYYFQNPANLAADNVYDSLNNDAASQWAHGENIMMPQHRYVGIGTYYRRSNRSLYVLVEFSTKRPVVHKR